MERQIFSLQPKTRAQKKVEFILYSSAEAPATRDPSRFRFSSEFVVRSARHIAFGKA